MDGRDQNYSGSGRKFPEINFRKLVILLRHGPCLELIFVSSNLRLCLLARRITGISVKGVNSIENVLRNAGPALSRINSEIISARTVKRKGAF